MQIVGQLQHSGIVQALDAGEDYGAQYLVMEVVDGADLRRVVQTVGLLELADACEITFQIAKALEYAHSRKLVHRDIKPSNVMLSSEGAVKVMDLGIAKFADQQYALTSTQQALGSLDFMAPEQFQSQDADSRADVFALGCTLHFLLTGEPPTHRGSASLLASKSPKLDSLRSILPPPLTRLLQHMLLADPTECCESMAKVADRVKPFCGSANLAQLAAKSASLMQPGRRGPVEPTTHQVVTRSPVRWRRHVFGGLTVAQEAKRLVILDGAGNVLAFDLPQGKLAWRISPPIGEPLPERLGITPQDDVWVQTVVGQFHGFRISDGTEAEIAAQDRTDERSEIAQAASHWNLQEGETELCESVSPTHDFGRWIVSQGRRAWVLETEPSRDASRRVFVHAEHEAPITAVLTFENDSIVLTADVKGQTRLWQAPNTRYSDMLLGCVTKIDSMEMSFALRRNRWTKDAFSMAPDRVPREG